MSDAAAPLTAEEEAKFRESVRMLGPVDDYGLAGTLHWSNRVAARLLATIDALRAEPSRSSPDPDLTARIREALPHAVNFRFLPPRVVTDPVWDEMAADIASRLSPPTPETAREADPQ